MTLTSHGHHIPGTVDTDEPVEYFSGKARCGGPRLCKTCKTEACQALPDDSIAKASLLNDLDALVVKEEQPEPLFVTKFHKKGPDAEVMFFMGKEEEADAIIRWLKSHGIPASFQEELDETIHSDYAASRKIHIPAKLVIGNGQVGRDSVYIDAGPETAIVHYDGDRNIVDVIPQKHFQDNWVVCQEIDPAAGIIQVEVK